MRRQAMDWALILIGTLLRTPVVLIGFLNTGVNPDFAYSHEECGLKTVEENNE